jgi:tetratricopeptide (TPR) repeat protein
MSAVFLSYSSDQGDAASRIELSLKEDGHSVFRDRSSLPAGEAYDAQIREAVEECEIFVFLVSRESVSPGRYTLTELGFAEHKWGNPSGHVLPVLIEPVARESIPAFLRAVTMLNPEGNLTAEVASEVARMTASWWRRMLAPHRMIPATVALILAAAIAWLGLPTYLDRRAQLVQVRELIKQSQAKADEDRYEEAWKLLEEARALAPQAVDVPQAQERLAMEWLRIIGLGRWTSDDVRIVVDKAAPILVNEMNEAKGERLADLLAHSGWAEYLRILIGTDRPGPLQTIEHYRRALDVDPRNVYAHAMWGFEILRVTPGEETAIAPARKHFDAAVATGRERAYVRDVEIAALLRPYEQVWAGDPAREAEAIRVANEMRVAGEARPIGFKGRLWSIYHFDLVTADHLERLLRGLPPAEHLATFRWLFPESELVPDQSPSLMQFLHVLAQLQEHGGDRAGALESYRRLLVEARKKNYDSSTATRIVDHANAAVKRLSG